MKKRFKIVLRLNMATLKIQTAWYNQYRYVLGEDITIEKEGSKLVFSNGGDLKMKKKN